MPYGGREETRNAVIQRMLDLGMTTSAGIPLAGHVPGKFFVDGMGATAIWAKTELYAGRMSVEEFVNQVRLAQNMQPRRFASIISSGSGPTKLGSAYQQTTDPKGPGPAIVKGLHSLYDFGKTIGQLELGHDNVPGVGHDRPTVGPGTGRSFTPTWGYGTTLSSDDSRPRSFQTQKRTIDQSPVGGHTGAGSTMFGGKTSPMRPKGSIPTGGEGHDNIPGVGHDATGTRGFSTDAYRAGARRIRRYPTKRTSYHKRKARTTKRKATRRRTRQRTWVDSLNDPCHVIGMKIPDGQIFPTRTAQIKIIRTLTVDGTGGRIIVEVNPLDLQWKLDDAGATSHLVHYPTLNGSGVVTSDPGVLWTKTLQDNEPDIGNLHTQAVEMRVVSACMKAHFMGNTHDDQGTITGGQLKGATWFDDDLAAPGFGTINSIDQFQDSTNSKVFPLREGCEVKWAPANTSDTEFTKINPVKTAANNSVRAESSAIAIAVNGAKNDSVPIRLEIFINVEYTPRHGVSTGTKSAGLLPWVLRMASEWAAVPEFMVHKVCSTTIA